MRMQVVDAFFNPAAGVKVPIRPKPSPVSTDTMPEPILDSNSKNLG